MTTTADPDSHPKPGSHPPDPGLQPERTALAWRRTALTIVVGGVIALRYLPSALGPWTAVLALAITATGVLALRAADRRYRSTRRIFMHTGLLTDGRLPLLVTIATCCGGLLCLAFVLAEPITPA